MPGIKYEKALTAKPAPETTRVRQSGRRCNFRHETSSTQEITSLLHAWHNGDNSALDRLMPLVHGELSRMARRYMQRESPGHILETTALVNEVYIKLIGARNIAWRDSTHFFALSAKLMRRVLVDFARARGYQKRGSTFRRVDLTDQISAPVDRNLVALDNALGALSKLDSQKARIVELKFFEGLTIEEIAKELKISLDRVKREWSLAQRWLFCAMSCRESHGLRTDLLYREARGATPCE